MRDRVESARMPRHVAIIMDGNGRWAQARGLPRAMGHRRGVEALRGVVRASSDLRVEVLTLYAFSTENWRRSKEEVGVLMGLLLEFFKKETDALHENHVRVRLLGDLSGLPAQQRAAGAWAMEKTRDNTGLQLNIAVNYGGRDELVRAARGFATRVARGELAASDITEATFRDALDTRGQPDVDLLIRTGGDQRISNFLPYQAAYAELLFVEALWPDFTVDAYRRALDAYAARDRRFGGRGEEA